LKKGRFSEKPKAWACRFFLEYTFASLKSKQAQKFNNIIFWIKKEPKNMFITEKVLSLSNICLIKKHK